jgi:GNAT superfamily N-acetyltransferase
MATGKFVTGRVVLLLYSRQMPIVLLPDDLAPGDARSREFDFADFTINRIRSTTDPLFHDAYDRLNEEFGHKHEIETLAVLADRFSLHPAHLIDGTSFYYEMLLVRRDGEFAAARDQNAMIARSPGGRADVIVHLSHLLIDKAYRKTGLAGWMRAVPLETARRAMKLAGVKSAATTTLVGEMDLPHPAHQDRMIRLRAYEKAGFLKIDPRAIPFLQPDFRDPVAIDLTGGPQPIPMSLIVRRVGHEAEHTITRREVRRLVRSLYQMYSQGFRAADMRACYELLDTIVDSGEPVALLPPTHGGT